MRIVSQCVNAGLISGDKIHMNDTFIRTTDPDTVISRKGDKWPKLRYKDHRAVGNKHDDDGYTINSPRMTLLPPFKISGF